MKDLQKYTKSLAALSGAAAAILGVLASASKWIQAVIPLLTAVSVYQVKNKGETK